MAVDQARQMNFFREMININNNNNQIQISNNNNNSYNESLLLPFYNLNDVVFATAGKLPPAVKDDSGVTFNNSLVLPSSVPVSRKRHRETPVLQQQQQQQHNPVVVVEKRSNGFCFLGEDLSLQIMQQQLELDRLISQHMEKMRMEIEDRKKQQLRRIMAAIEEAMERKLKNKEEELNKIGKINFALEERVKSLIIENQIWRDLAQTNEATANALRTNIEQLLQQPNNKVEHPELTDDAVSCCGSSGYGGEEEEEELNDTKRRRVCGERTHLAILASSLLVLAAHVATVTFQVTNIAGNTEGGTRFENEIGAPYARQTLSDATNFVWKILQQNNTADRKDVQQVSLSIEDINDDVSYTKDNQIHLSASYIQGYSGDLKKEVSGIIYHETTHVWQYNGNGQTPDVWLEGMADFVRFKDGYAPDSWDKPGQGDSWDQGHDVALFFNYCNTLKNGFVAQLNAKMKTSYSDAYFSEILGKSVEQLWTEYKAKYN